MQLDHHWLQSQGEDAYFLRIVANAFPDKKPTKIGIAVSGGGDSMALLHLYIRLAEQTGQAIAAVTVDHTLRDGSAAEAAQVSEFCARHGVPHATLVWDTWDGHGNVQATAREARYGLIAEWARANGIDGVVLGHTKDDSAETFVMRLARKSGIDGLSLMDRYFEKDGLWWARPLWLFSRAELRGYLTRNSVKWIDDPSNDDMQFDRIRVRKALSVLTDVGVSTDAIHHSAMAIGSARTALEHYTAQEAKTFVIHQGGDLLVQNTGTIPDEIERRLRSKAVQWIGRRDYPPRTGTMRDLQNGLLLEGKQTVSGCIVTLEDGMLRIARELNAVRNMTCETSDVWDTYWQLTGPHAPNLHIAALGEAIKDCPDWRNIGLPRHSLMATPAIWRGDALIAAPVAGLQNGWNAQIVADFHSSLLTH